MCIIIHKTKDGILTKDDVFGSYWHNKDGFGIMFQQDGEVHGYKGFMTFDHILEACEALGFYSPKYEVFMGEFIMHLRLATHGTINAANCHPFPVSNSWEDLSTLFWRGKYGIAHNGIISSFDHLKEYSDTQHFIKFYADELQNNPVMFIHNIEKYAGFGNKFAVMTPSVIHHIGTWYDYHGCMVTNSFIGWDNSYTKAWGKDDRYDEYDEYLAEGYGAEGFDGCEDTKTFNKWCDGKKKEYGQSREDNNKIHDWCFYEEDCFECPHSYFDADAVSETNGTTSFRYTIDNLQCSVWEKFVKPKEITEPENENICPTCKALLDFRGYCFHCENFYW